MSTLLHTVTVRRLIKAERNQVFEAFSNVDALSQWFSPSADIAVEFEAFEFTPQGKFRLRYTMPNGSQPFARYPHVYWQSLYRAFFYYFSARH